MKQIKFTSNQSQFKDIELSDDLKSLVEKMAINVHNVWAQSRLDQGWTYGEKRDDSKMTHPCLIDYDSLPDIEKDYDRNTAKETLKLILQEGFKITK